MKIPRTKLKYYKETRYIIKKKMNYKSIMQVPKLTKICINQGIGSAVSDKTYKNSYRRNYSNNRSKSNCNKIQNFYI